MLCAVDKDRYSFGGSVACNNEIETGMSFTARSQPTKGSKEGCLLEQKMTCMLHTSLSMCGLRVAHIPFCVWIPSCTHPFGFCVAHIPFYVCIPCCTHAFLCVHSVLHTSLSMCAFRVTHMPFCVCIPCCTHAFLCVHSVLHTCLSVCAFRVTHMPFYVCIPCCTHAFLCVHSVLHPFLCVHSVLLTSLSMCAFRVIHIPFYVCIPCYAQWTVRCRTRAGVAKIITRRRTAGRRATLRTPCSVPSSVECVPVSCVYCPILCGVCPGELCILSRPLWSVFR